MAGTQHCACGVRCDWVAKGVVHCLLLADGLSLHAVPCRKSWTARGSWRPGHDLGSGCEQHGHFDGHLLGGVLEDVWSRRWH